MRNTVLIFDTSLLVVWLQVAGFDRAGPDHDLWDFNRIDTFIQEQTNSNATFILPLATLIETGNLICKSKREERSCPADKLAKLMELACKGTSPWAIFSEQSVLWEPSHIMELAREWPSLTNRKRCLSMGDATIKKVADYYAQLGYRVDIFTADTGLKQFQPKDYTLFPPPRRRQ